MGTRSILNPGLERVRTKQHFRPRLIYSGFIACWICLKCLLSENGEMVGIFKVEWQLNKLFRDLGTRSILNPGLEWVRKKQHFRPHSIFSGFIACWIWLKCRLSEKGEILGILKVEWL